MTRDELLGLSDERDAWERFAYELAALMYQAGYRDGRRDQARDDDRAWAAIPVQRHRVEPTFAELELRRWGPGGRERFGDPRPGDYQGRERAA